MLLLQNKDSLFSKPKTQNTERVRGYRDFQNRDSLWDEKPMIKRVWGGRRVEAAAEGDLAWEVGTVEWRLSEVWMWERVESMKVKSVGYVG